MGCTTRCYLHDNTIVLGEHLGGIDTHEFCDQLDTVNPDFDVIVDGSRVQDIDTSALQLLAALAIHLRNNGHRLCWISPSSSLLATALLSGLSDQLGLDVP
ncbi:MAG: STAS domain-containing protein [Pseudomonadota bacterium]